MKKNKKCDKYEQKIFNLCAILAFLIVMWIFIFLVNNGINSNKINSLKNTTFKLYTCFHNNYTQVKLPE